MVKKKRRPALTRQNVEGGPQARLFKAYTAARDKLTREIVDYEPPETQRTFLARGKELAPFLPWGSDAPTPLPFKTMPSVTARLPKADYLVVTWTVAEGFALGDTLTPGYRDVRGSKKPPAGIQPWYIYRRMWASYLPKLRRNAPALQANRLGSYFMNATVLCFKCELHLNRDWVSVDHPTIPVADLLTQIISEVEPKMVITTGTAGGTDDRTELGDVMVTRAATFRLTREFKNAPFDNKVVKCSTLEPFSPKAFEHAQGLILAHYDKLDQTLAKRPPKIWIEGFHDEFPAFDPILTTDKFEYGTTKVGKFPNYLGSEGCGVEMGDAVLGLVIDQMENPAPKPPWILSVAVDVTKKVPFWLVIRNASDPQIDANLPPRKQVEEAGNIYMKYGYWTTVNSAIAVWAVISDRQ
jgi:hypothetical protein